MNPKTSLHKRSFPSSFSFKIRAISVLTVMAFLCSDLLSFPAQGLAQSINVSHVQGGNDTSLLASASASRGNVQELVVPPELGTIQEMDVGKRMSNDGKFKSGFSSSVILPPSSGKFVILIQDAHSIPDAQRSLAKLIEYFQEKYGVGTVALEGAEGKLDPTLFRMFPDAEKRKAVFDDYLATGELSGVAAASVLMQGKAEFVGIEDWRLYEEGVHAFLSVLGDRPSSMFKVQNSKRNCKS